MPVSDVHGIPAILNEVALLNPKTVLELGIGFGKWGVLLREILDARYGRCSADRWRTRIDGFEIFSEYENPAWHLYDKVYEGDFVGCHVDYDLVMLIDSLEHVQPAIGRQFLASLIDRNKHLIISVPNGPMPQGETFGNPHEAHLWTFNGTEEFEPYKFKLIHQSVCTVVSIQGEA